METEKIPFEVMHEGKKVVGELWNMDIVPGLLPRWFHVYVNRYYHGQLIFRESEGKWILPDSKYEEHAEYLGQVIEWYYGKHLV